MATRRARTTAEDERVREATRVIGRTIRSLRIARAWTLEQASEAIDLDPRHLQRIERGKVSPSAATLVRIADSLHVHVGALVESVVAPGTRPPEDVQEPPSTAAPDDTASLPARLGQRIATLRRERGWTQARLANDAQVTEQYVQRVESGRQNPSIRVVGQIARALGVTLSELVRLDGA